MSEVKQKQLSTIEKKVLRLIPSMGKKGKTMISEIWLVNLAFLKEKISPFQTLEAVRKLLRIGEVYQPNDHSYRKVSFFSVNKSPKSQKEN